MLLPLLTSLIEMSVNPLVFVLFARVGERRSDRKEKRVKGGRGGGGGGEEGGSSKCKRMKAR